MSLADWKKKFTGGSTAGDPSHAFGSESDMMEALRQQEFTPPKPKVRAAAVVQNLRDRLGMGGGGEMPQEERPPRDESLARDYAPEAMAQPEWENPFTSPAPTRSSRPARREAPVYEDMSAGYAQAPNGYAPYGAPYVQGYSAPAYDPRYAPAPGYYAPQGYYPPNSYAPYAQGGYAQQYAPYPQQQYAPQYQPAQPQYAPQYTAYEPTAPRQYAPQYEQGVQQQYAPQYEQPAQQPYAPQYEQPVQQPYAPQYEQPSQAQYEQGVQPQQYEQSADPAYVPPVPGEAEFVPPGYAAAPSPTAPERRRRSSLQSGDLRYLLWSGSIVSGVILTLVAFIYACAA